MLYNRQDHSSVCCMKLNDSVHSKVDRKAQEMTEFNYLLSVFTQVGQFIPRLSFNTFFEENVPKGQTKFVFQIFKLPRGQINKCNGQTSKHNRCQQRWYSVECFHANGVSSELSSLKLRHVTTTLLRNSAASIGVFKRSDEHLVRHQTQIL